MTNHTVEVPHSSFRGVISPPELRALSQPVRWRVVRDLSLIWVQVIAAGALYVLHPSWWTFVIAFVLMAGGQHGLMLATHEFVHYSLFPGHRRMNDILGTWLFGAPSGIPYSLFRFRHFKHHRTYSSDDDPKVIYRNSPLGLGLLWEIVRSMTGYEYVHHVLIATEQRMRDTAAGIEWPKPLPMLPSLVITQAVIALIFTLVASPWLYLTLWLLPMLTLAQLFHKFRAMMEHRPLEDQRGARPGSGYYGETPGPFVRTVRASWWERLIVCKLNFGFHAEHHLWPTISYQHLPQVHERLKASGAFADPRFGCEATYFRTIYKLWRPASSGHASAATTAQVSR